MLQSELCAPSPSRVDAPTPSVTVFGNRTVKQVIKVKYDHKTGDIIEHDWGPLRRGSDILCAHMSKTHVRTRRLGGCLQAEEKGLLTP